LGASVAGFHLSSIRWASSATVMLEFCFMGSGCGVLEVNPSCWHFRLIG
jgi:hypothetical protein